MEAATPRLPSAAGSFLSILGADRSALKRSSMQTIPADAYDHLEALKHYDDTVIFYWLALLRGRTHRIQTEAKPVTETSLRSSYSSAATRSSNTSSLFSEHDRRISGSSCSTEDSQPSPYMSPNTDVDEAERPEPLRSPSLCGADDDESSTYSTSTLIPSYYCAAARTTSMSTVDTAAAPSPKVPAEPLRKRFFCTFCAEGFTSKAAWKLHEEENHEKGRQWLCIDCGQDFYSETSLVDHHEKQHDCQACSHAVDSVMPTERRVAWGCGMCRALLDNWDQRCEHIAAHFEEGKTLKEWKHSKVVYALLHQDDVIDVWRNYIIARQLEGAQMRFCWNRAEVRDQLEELEFGRYPRDVDFLVRKAYDLGIQDRGQQPMAEAPLPLTSRFSIPSHTRTVSVDKPLPRTPPQLTTNLNTSSSTIRPFAPRTGSQPASAISPTCLPPLSFDTSPIFTFTEAPNPAAASDLRRASEAVRPVAFQGNYDASRTNRAYSESNVNDSFADLYAELPDNELPRIMTPLPSYQDVISPVRRNHMDPLRSHAITAVSLGSPI